jgi:hypothetical protein
MEGGEKGIWPFHRREERLGSTLVDGSLDAKLYGSVNGATHPPRESYP